MNLKLDERMLAWPYFWCAALGAAILPIVNILIWTAFRVFFPDTEAASHVDDIMFSAREPWLGHALFVFIFTLPLQAFWGALLGCATEVAVREYLVKSRSARVIAVLCGAVGIYYFGFLFSTDWPALLHPDADKVNFATAITSALFVAAPFSWSVLLVFLGLFLLRR